jgi:hypothetical protein
VILNGFFVVDDGITLPLPVVVIVTFVAPPPNVFPGIVIGVVSQVVPLVLLRVTVGGLEHCPGAILEINKKMEAKRRALVIFSITYVIDLTIMSHNSSTITAKVYLSIDFNRLMLCYPDLLINKCNTPVFAYRIT